jgi:DNA-binding response OmpR family regulator
MNQILFMSSDPVLRQKNIEVLSQNGLVVNDSADCLGGLLKVDRNAFDIIIIDEELSDYDGYEACQKIRQHSEIPIILIGTRPDSEVWDKVEELGFDIYMSKPISPRELLARIKAIIRRPATEKKQDVYEEAEEPYPVSHQAKKTAEESLKSYVEPEKASPASQTADKSFRPRVVEREEQPAARAEESAAVKKAGPLRSQSVFDESSAGGKEKMDIKETSTPNVPVTPPPLKEVVSERVVPNPVIPADSAADKQLQETSGKKTYCTNCGRPSMEGQRFCGFCGSKLPDLNQKATFVPDLETSNIKPVEKETFPETIYPYSISKPVQSVQTIQVVPPVKTTIHTDIVETEPSQPAAPPEGTFQIWEDGRAVKLVEALVNGKITDIAPIIDLSSKNGFSYPQINTVIDGNDDDTTYTLDSLEKANILIKKPYEKLLMDPDGTFQLIPQERCPNCDSANLISGQLIEHFYCGYVGMEQDFKTDHRYVCPKCHRDLKLIGTDYRNAGIHYRCLDCNEVFNTPVVKWRSLNTHKVWNADELRQIWVYSYSFSPEKKDWLEFQLKPKSQLVDFLKLQGYQVQEFAQLSGSSGAVHTLDILATRDDILTKINLGVGILVAMPGEQEVQLDELFKYDTRAYDVGINYKVVIAIPKLSAEAIKFAERQMIRAYESKTLGALVSNITSQPRSRPSTIIETPDSRAPRLDQSIAQSNEPRALLVRFLRNRGYEVFERAKIIGKSGAEHIFDIIARRDDGIVVPTIAVDTAILGPGQEVEITEISQFDSEAYDAGIRNKVFVGIPRISVQGIQFARQQKIKTIDTNDLRNFM